MQRIGELAAFGTAVCWTFSAIIFEQGVKRIGVLPVNLIKVAAAFLFLALSAGFLRGMPFPADAPAKAWIFLSLSGLVGFVVGDMFLFSAYRTVGSRIAMLFSALSPPVTAGMAYFFLGETIGPKGIAGMGLVVTGICMTISGRQNGLVLSKMRKEDKRGYLSAFCSALCAPVAMNLTKTGLGTYDPVSGTQIRVLAAAIGFATVSCVFDRGAGIRKAMKNPAGLKYTVAGAVFGPFLGVALSLYAVQRVSAGIVSTLIGLTPVLITVPEIFILKRKVAPLEIAGALTAVCGTAVFFL